MAAKQTKETKAAKSIAGLVRQIKAEERAMLSERKAQLRELLPHDFYMALRPYQREDTAIVLSHWIDSVLEPGLNHGFLNASEMGLGKTVETAAMLVAANRWSLDNLGAKLPMGLYLTKVGLVTETSRKLMQWGVAALPVPTKSTERKAQVNFYLSGVLKFPEEVPELVVANYESLNTNPELLDAYPWSFVIVDECHKLKGGANNKPTQIWKNTKNLIHPMGTNIGEVIELLRNDIAQGAKHRPYPLFLSGSPMQNSALELWAYLHIFAPEVFPSLKHFEATFLDNRGMLDLNKLFGLLSGQILKRTKESCKIDLPPVNKIVETIELDMDSDQGKLYRRVAQESMAYLKDQPVVTFNMFLEQILRLRMITQCGSNVSFTKWVPITDDPDGPKEKMTFEYTLNGPFPKLDAIEDKIWETINEGQQVVVFSTLNDSLYDLQSRFSFLATTAIINGKTKNVSEVAEEFRQGNIRVLFVNMRSGAEGLDLNRSKDWPGGASTAIFVDSWWNNEVNEQCLARVHRVNSIVDIPVFVYYYHVQDTVEDIIAELCAIKSEEIAHLMDSDEVKAETVNKLIEHLENL